MSPQPRSQYRASTTVIAETYNEAIKQAGDEMDTIWGNGNWELISCDAHPWLITSASQKLSWEWSFEIDWLGLRES